jgi:hypothetical protein
VASEPLYSTEPKVKEPKSEFGSFAFAQNDTNATTRQRSVARQPRSPLAQLYGSISTFSIRRDATAVLAGA